MLKYSALVWKCVNHIGIENDIRIQSIKLQWNMVKAIIIKRLAEIHDVQVLCKIGYTKTVYDCSWWELVFQNI